MGWPLWWVFWVWIVLQEEVKYTLGQWAVGISWLGQWTFGVFLFLPFYYPPQPTLGRFLLSLPMDRQQHHYMRIQNFIPVAALNKAPPPWCQSRTLILDFLPLDDQVDWQALKWSIAGCPISAPFHFEVHQFSCLYCFP